MNRLKERATLIALDAQRRRVADLAGELRERLSGVGVAEQAGAIVLTGSRLMARWLADPALRFLSGPRP